VNNADRYANMARTLAQRAQELNEKYGVYCSAIKDRYFIDSMPVIVSYTAIVGRVEYFKRSEEHIFVQTRTLPDQPKMQWEEVIENPYAIRDEFFKVETVGQAVEFIQKTGVFSPLRQRLTWTEFQRWQRFARLVQEHDQLASAMQSNAWDGDCGGVLTALAGIYNSWFFHGCEDALYLSGETERDAPSDLRYLLEMLNGAGSHEEWLSAHQREMQELTAQDAREKWEREKKRNWRKLWQWFIKPPVGIEWLPNSKVAAHKVQKYHVDPATGQAILVVEESPIARSGAMIEFMLPQEQLVPILEIRPTCALEAIAAVIYAERVRGISYRKCVWCGELFRIDKHKNKQFCEPPKPCKGNAHKQRQRARQREEKALAASKHPKGKARQAPRP
jgi:hypothetical protein